MSAAVAEGGRGREEGIYRERKEEREGEGATAMKRQTSERWSGGVEGKREWEWEWEWGWEWGWREGGRKG
jgi:hypothetical protein